MSFWIPRALERRGETITHQERQHLANGQVVTIFDLTAGNRMTRMTVDEATNLVIRMEHYRNNALVGALEKIEYNIDIPEEVFQINIPENADVVDNMASPPEEPYQEGKARTQSKAAGEQPVVHVSRGNRGARSGSPFHMNLRFEVSSDDAVTITYISKTNAYRVVGKVLALGMGLNMVVENSEFIAPRPPDVTVEQFEAERARRNREAIRRMPSPEVRAQWDAKAEELRAAGAKHLWMGGPGSPRVYLDFEPLTERYIYVWYSPVRNEYYVMGKARVQDRRGFDKTVEDGWIKVPGPAPKLSK